MPEASASRSGASSSSDHRGASSNSDGALEPDEIDDAAALVAAAAAMCADDLRALRDALAHAERRQGEHQQRARTLG